tara:strand:+ start:393 stop:560 length:168 start_codon:yes stop_codon:yes gene_type:complete
VSQELLPFINKKPGVVATHLLKGDKKASETETKEEAMREKPDKSSRLDYFYRSNR